MNKKKALLRKLRHALARIKEHKETQPDFSILFFSSLVFLTNALAAYRKHEELYTLLFISLTGTSLIVHSYDTLYTNILDKFAITIVISYGGFLLYSALQITPFTHITVVILSKIFLTFLITFYIYIVGYYTRSFCFHPSISIANQYHMALHLISSIGHHCILLL